MRTGKLMSANLLRTLASRWNKEKFRCYEAQIEESEKAGSCRESLSGCRSSVAEHWLHKPGVSWVRFPAAAGLFTLLYLRLITSKFLFILPTYLRVYHVLSRLHIQWSSC